MWVWQSEEKEKDHRLIRATPSIQTLGTPDGHTAGKEQMCDPRGRGETHTIPRLCTWGTLPLSKVTPPPQTQDLASNDPWLGPQVSAGWASKVEMSGFL